ncbi:TetR/AcrR family transcriptional regulator [Cryptosporangium aurantiacum]|uniref:Transcriptional regulator, TetR family n=1 Tax=Cryptosporangium aurantiacum TaxID=134849 RepID=A0A1M7PI29_9ACTN|nr:TetR/AcrR family transcriptional regulator [Cryptosporangium aurantiacum]SHN16574.1 transcriptional regulator, TetR family [Cryptosporangium aurantiacum]
MARPSRPSAPAEPHALGIEQIVAAALRVGVSKGFSALTMRSLADELGTSPMAAYYHVPNKNALLDLVIDSRLEAVEIPPPEFGPWDARVRELQGRSAAALEPWAGLDLLVFERPPTTHGLRLMDGYLRILLDGGFTPRNAAQAFSILHAYGMSRVAFERRLQDADRGSDRSEERAQWPALRVVEDVWADLHRSDLHDFAMDVVLDGLRDLLARQ